jgi:hypothetical protein
LGNHRHDDAETNICSAPIKLVFSVTPGSVYVISFQEAAKVGTSQYTVDMYVPATKPMAVQLV